MRKPKERIPLEKKYSYMGQFGGSDEKTGSFNFETTEIKEDRYARSLGLLFISFSYVEDAVDCELAKLVNESSYEPGFRITKYLSFRDKINLLQDEYSSLIKGICDKSKWPKLLDEAKTIHGKLAELSEFRNRAAHANWSSLDSSGFVTSKVVENREDYGLSLEKVKMTPSVLIKFIRQNHSISNKLDPFTDKIWEIYNREESKRYKKAQGSSKM